MVKSTIPPSHKAEPQERNRSHPLLRNDPQVEAFMSNAAKRREQEELIIERVEDWKECLNRIAGSKDGQHFFKMMIKACNLFAPGTSRDTVRAVEDKQRQDFYLRHVRPYLPSNLRAEIE